MQNHKCQSKERTNVVCHTKKLQSLNVKSTLTLLGLIGELPFWDPVDALADGNTRACGLDSRSSAAGAAAAQSAVTVASSTSGECSVVASGSEDDGDSGRAAPSPSSPPTESCGLLTAEVDGLLDAGLDEEGVFFLARFSSIFARFCCFSSSERIHSFFMPNIVNKVKLNILTWMHESKVNYKPISKHFFNLHRWQNLLVTTVTSHLLLKGHLNSCKVKSSVL